MDQSLPLKPAMIIEDEEYLAALYAKALSMAGFELTIFNDGLNALNALKKMEYSPVLIILDLNLPRTSGREILRFIRGCQRFARTRVIIITSESAAVQGEIEDKSDIVLLKPIGMSQLRELSSRFR